MTGDDQRDAAKPATPRRTSRRDFLRVAGLTAAGLGVGGVAGGIAGYQAGVAVPDAETAPALDPEPKPGFEHVVVLMAENRSFDNLLGWLYTEQTLPAGENFDGLAFGEHSNTLPDGTRVKAHVYTGPTDTIMQSPDPDPGEEYPHVNTQLFDTVRPAGNASGDVGEMRYPFNAPKAGTRPRMDGFLTDYRIHLRSMAGGREPDPERVAQIMGGFSPEMLPVVSTLAKEFAVYDHWYAAVPSQTFCNRSFFHASTSHGFVTNQFGGGYRKWIDAPPEPTIFNRLEEAGESWVIYFDALQLISYTGMLHAPVLEKFWATRHFRTMEDFYADAAAGSLPAYAFIEPRLVFNHNDFHPPVGALRSTEIPGLDVVDSAESDVRAGELLVHNVYEAIRTSGTGKGSNALNTLFLLTFDEHGGTYDHVAPPDAEPPFPGSEPGEMGFSFDRLGVRVPAIAVSAYTKKGTIVHDEMHHGSVVATLSRLHGLRPLTARDEQASTLFNVVNLDAPRHPSTWPTTHPQYNPPNPEAEPPHPANVNRDKPLSPPARGLLGILIAKYDPSYPQPETFEDAYEALQKYGTGLFGVAALDAESPSPTPE